MCNKSPNQIGPHNSPLLSKRSHSVTRKHWRTVLVVFVGVLISLTSCQSGEPPIPLLALDLKAGKPLVTITKWRIVGPFRLPEKNQTYTPTGFQEAFAHDYLTDIKGSEVPLTLPKPTTNRSVDFAHDPNDDPDIGPADVQFIDQVQQFPTPQVNTQQLFWKAGEFFKIIYAATTVVANADTEVVLIVSGNSPVKIWANSNEILQSTVNSVGNDPDLLHLVKVPLKKGRNELLVKMFCFPKRNEFVVRLATREGALAFTRDRGGLRDVINEVVLPPNQPLRLSDNLPFFTLGHKAKVKIADRDGNTVLDELLDLKFGSEIQTQSLAAGLYTITVAIDEWMFSQNFYIGPRDAIATPFEKRCSKTRENDICAPLVPLREIATHARSSFRRDWQKRALFLIEQLEVGLAPTSIEHGPGTGARVFSYRSKIDGQNQYYFFYAPENREGKPLPLVVISPHNTVKKPMLSSPLATNPDSLRKAVAYANEYGYACLWTFGRGRNNDTPLAVTDTLEALADAERRFPIDRERLYLTGDCGGARNALLLAQRFPDRFAAVSLLNSATSASMIANGLWRNSNTPRNSIENLSNIPLQLIHGDLFPHSPTQQSIELRDLALRAGMNPELILLPGDTRWADQDPLRMSFAFFRGKVLQTPQSVTLTTGLLKYGEAYWLRVTELAKPPALGKVVAQLTGPQSVKVESSDISEFQLLLEKMPPEFRQSGLWEIATNGAVQKIQVEGQEPITIRIPRAEKPDDRQKAASLEGPVLDAFAGPFLIVQSSAGDQRERAATKALADAIASGWLDNYYVPCKRKTDKELTPDDIATANLIITAGPTVAGHIKRIFDSLPVKLQASQIIVGDHTIKSNSALVAAVYPNPLNTQRYVVVIVTNALNDVELPLPDLARTGSYDVAAWELRSEKVPRRLGQWFWDTFWSQLTDAGDIGTDPGSVEAN